MVEKLLELAERQPVYEKHAMLYLCAYSFLLRLPSEALPIVAETGGGCTLRREGSELVLHLRRRKNRPAGSTLRRRCWCTQSRISCPVHRLGPWLDRVPRGKPLFPGISVSQAVSKLREMLWLIGVADSASYRTHDLRRGHAKDLQESGGHVCVALTGRERARGNLLQEHHFGRYLQQDSGPALLS